MAYVDATLAANASTDPLILIGNCDIWIDTLTSGAVKLQIRHGSGGTWKDVPDASYTEDVFKTIFISGDQVYGRLTGVSNSTSVYVRLSRFQNT